MKGRNSRAGGLLGRLRRRDEGEREVAKSAAAWREQLTPAQFHVLRGHGTEPPFSEPDRGPDAGGLYRCAGCDAALFRADAKFESGTGWPSFTASEPDGVELRRDLRLLIPRTEVRCRRCGGHLGHVFRDGPGPERTRYCINALAFAPGDGDDGGDGP
ncbi:MAG: peptide-methionine (R)-S-oxide reductase MsrB [Acidimicrobiales bacterium]